MLPTKLMFSYFFLVKAQEALTINKALNKLISLR
jgi:hypothetical protein